VNGSTFFYKLKRILRWNMVYDKTNLIVKYKFLSNYNIIMFVKMLHEIGKIIS
jgi:hypothetical protein